VKLPANTAMHALVASIDVRSKRQGFKAVNKQIVNFFLAKLLHNLSSKSEMLRQRSRLVIASEHVDLLWVVQLEAEQKENDLERPVASVHVVTKK